MGKPAAGLGDKVTGVDTHIVLVPSSGGPIPTPMSLPFAGTITGGCSTNVLIGGTPAAVLGATATNLPPHVAPSGRFAVEPTNRGTVFAGSTTVLINGKPAARAGDRVLTCNDPAPLPTSAVVATSTVLIGG
jgi:uncharacterized Zn-binding protein involved in type VI secretion